LGSNFFQNRNVCRWFLSKLRIEPQAFGTAEKGRNVALETFPPQEELESEDEVPFAQFAPLVPPHVQAEGSEGARAVVRTARAPSLEPTSDRSQPLAHVAAFDREYQPLQSLAAKTFRRPVQVPLTPQEKERLAAYDAKVTALETRLSTQYKDEFGQFDYHGASSYARLLWQDKEFLQAMADPMFVKALLLRHQTKKEQNLVPGAPFPITVSSLFLAGLKDNQPAYLLTVQPNWYKPHETKQLGAAEVELFQGALNTAKQVLEQLPTSKSVQPQETRHSEVIDDINRASPRQLVSTISELITPENKFDAVAGGAVTASFLDLTDQCFTAMADIADLESDAGAVKALGDKWASHNLDALHLLAAVYYLTHTDTDKDVQKREETSRLWPEETRAKFQRGKEALGKLLTKFVDPSGGMGTEPATLLQVRLRQSVHRLYDTSNDPDSGVEIDRDAFRSALQRPPEAGPSQPAVEHDPLDENYF
jgi:hypothetical protein